MPHFGNRTAIEELDKLLAGGVSNATSSDLLVMVRLASAVHEQSIVPSPDPAFKARLRADLLRLEPVVRATPATRLRDVSDQFVRRARVSMRAAVATATAASMLGTAGVAAAAESAIPGDALYSVKEFVESTRLALADSGVEDGRLQLRFAAERLDELEGGLQRLSTDQMVSLLGRMDDQSIAGAEDLLTVAAGASSSSLLVLVADFTTAQTVRLADLRDELPAAAVPFADLSLETLRRIQLQVDAIASSDCECEAVAVPASGIGGVIDAVQQPSVVIPDIVITRPGDGPAAPTRPCGCDAVAVPPPREPVPAPTTDIVPTPTPSGGAPTPGATPTPTPSDPDPTPGPDPTPDPTETESEDNGIVTVLPTPIGDLVSEIDDIVGEVLPDELEGPVDEIVQDVDDALDPVEDLVDDLLSELPLP